MSLFPQLSQNYYVDNDHDILKYMDYTYSKNITINQSFWAEADTDMRFVVGDQQLWNDIYGNLPAFKRRQYNFNRIRRVSNMITGYQRQHRKSTNVTPIEGSDDATANQMTKLIYHVNNTASVLNVISDSFEGGVKTGMNLISTWLDFRYDPVNGDIRVENIPYNGYLIDPYFTKPDLSDCNSLWARKYLSRQQVIALMPDRADEIKDLRGWGNRDGKFQFQPESYSYAQQDLLIFDEFWYLDTRKQKMIVDVESGECKEWRGQDDDLEELLTMFPTLTVIEQEIPTTKLAVVVQGKVMYHGPNPLNIDRYPFVPVFCYYEPEVPYFPNRVQGIVRSLRDSQYLYNRRMITALDILESQITSGFIYKEDSLVNPKDVFLQGQGKGLALKQDAQMTDVMPIQPPQVPPSMMQITEMLGNELTQISGVNEELLGSADDDKAGILSMLRQGAGLVTLQKIFDQLDVSQKLLGQMHMEIIQANWTPGKVRRIIDEEPTEQFYNRAFGKYDCVIEEAPLTATQKQLALQKALYLREIGIPITTEYLITHSNLPDKDELIESVVQQEQQQAQMEQQRAQLEMQNMQVDNETKLSYAESQRSLAAERMNKVKLDAALSAERIQRADEDRTNSVLNLVKAAKELQEMDLDQLQKELDIIEQLASRREERIPQTQEATL